jgi:hypothetical protein
MGNQKDTVSGFYTSLNIIKIVLTKFFAQAAADVRGAVRFQ